MNRSRDAQARRTATRTTPRRRAAAASSASASTSATLAPATVLQITDAELHTLTTALGDYRDAVMRDLDREPDCRTYRTHLQETCTLLDRLANL